MRYNTISERISKKDKYYFNLNSVYEYIFKDNIF